MKQLKKIVLMTYLLGAGFYSHAIAFEIKAKQKADSIIKNTYRALMTRGMKGCYIYSVDNETQEYFERMVK